MDRSERWHEQAGGGAPYLEAGGKLKGLRDRCDRVFIDADEQVRQDIQLGLANAAAAGRLGSGATAVMAVDACEARTGQALDQVHDEVSKQIEHRGRQWAKAMGQVGEALEVAFASWPATVAPALKLAGVERGTARAACDHKIDVARNKLRARHTAYAAGWTAARSKSWRDRHAALYALILLLAGALVGEAVKQGASAIFPERTSRMDHRIK